MSTHHASSDVESEALAANCDVDTADVMLQSVRANPLQHLATNQLPTRTTETSLRIEEEKRGASSENLTTPAKEDWHVTTTEQVTDNYQKSNNEMRTSDAASRDDAELTSDSDDSLDPTWLDGPVPGLDE